MSTKIYVPTLPITLWCHFWALLHLRPLAATFSLTHDTELTYTLSNIDVTMMLHAGLIDDWYLAGSGYVTQFSLMQPQLSFNRYC